MSLPTKSIRFSQDHQDLLKLLAAFERVSEGELVERAIEAYLHTHVIAYRKTLGLSREEISGSDATAGELVETIRDAIGRALAQGGKAKSEQQVKNTLRQNAKKRKPKKPTVIPA